MAVSHFSRATSKAAVDAINAQLNLGSGAAKILFYNAPIPADTTVGITTQTKLGTCVCADPAATESGGTLTFSAIGADLSVDANGTVAWVRITDSADVVVMDLDVSVTGGGGYVQMPSTTVFVGGPLAFNNFTITLP